MQINVQSASVIAGRKGTGTVYSHEIVNLLWKDCVTVFHPNCLYNLGNLFLDDP
jgi:hypothetical protein